MDTTEKQYPQKDSLFFILATTVLLDALNGFISMYMSNRLEMIVPVIRVFFLVYFFIYLFKISVEVGISSITICITLFILNNFSLFIQNSVAVSVYLNSNIFLSKIIYFFVLFVLLKTLVLENKIDKLYFFSILKSNAYLISLLITIPTVLGLARQTYVNSGYGSSGFFIANNSTNFVLIITTGFLLYSILNKKLLTKYTPVFFLLSLYSLWLQGSKTSYFFLLCFLLIFLFGVTNINTITYSKIIFSICLSILFLIGCLYFFYNREKVVFFINTNLAAFKSRQLTAIQQHQNFYLYLNSGRTEFLKNIHHFFLTRYNYFFLLCGIGYTTLISGAGHLSEMDLFDLIYSSGIFSVLMTYGVFFSSSFKIIINNVITKCFKSYLLCNCLFIFLFSFFAGHVFVDIISSTIVAIIISMGYLNK